MWRIDDRISAKGGFGGWGSPRVRESLDLKTSEGHSASRLLCFRRAPDSSRSNRQVPPLYALRDTTGAIGSRLSLPKRDRTVWDRMQALGLEFLGPQAPHGRRAGTVSDDVSPDTRNVPTYYLCLLFIHPRARNLISLRSAGQ